MWFKLFVLLRLPVSATYLFGYGTGLYLLAGPGGFGGIVILGLFTFIAFTSIRLFRFRNGALGLAVALLLLELAGAVLIMEGGLCPAWRVQPADGCA
ncbi:MAG TPA: hypothetical protein VFV58_32095 [Blastocatellia bacterium]|jgi:hypothetical protein|nr:hypothetical protein [Blastocatellia bacterium]